ncbi:MAG TPA: hypothetical protein VFS43_41255 [Polyangiaceae bacterium]|nr:hypothetical protein [Polyangiaceae bacterium]
MSSTKSSNSRVETALTAARALVNALEVEDVPIEKCLMMAARLARLLRDSDAQTWIDLELRGYPPQTKPSQLGTCAKYANRWFPNGDVFTPSLPSLEATKIASAAYIEKLQGPTVNVPTENYLAAGATEQVLKSIQKNLANARDALARTSGSFAAAKASLHRYAADTLIALELGSEAEGIFDAARSLVDTFVRSHCPKAAEQLVAVSERMREGTAEAHSLALTSCRRLIATVADSVFPPQSEPYTDRGGKKRIVGEDQYKNRLLAYIETRISSGSTKSILDAKIEHIAARLEAVYEKACKGVHTDVTESEAKLVVIDTYLFIAEVARYALGQPASNSSVPAGQSDSGLAVLWSYQAPEEGGLWGPPVVSAMLGGQVERLGSGQQACQSETRFCILIKRPNRSMSRVRLGPC